MNELKKVLVVDDNAANLTVINGILSSLYKVYPVDSAATALKFMAKLLPDLILLDVEMPVMGGVELFEIIRADDRLNNVPVIFLTGHDTGEFEADAFRLGASDFIRKPVVDAVLLARVKMHLELAVLRAEKKSK